MNVFVFYQDILEHPTTLKELMLDWQLIMKIRREEQGIM